MSIHKIVLDCNQSNNELEFVKQKYCVYQTCKFKLLYFKSISQTQKYTSNFGTAYIA